MAFINQFNDKKSNFYFKDTLYSSTLNMYLKESSLISYSLVELLKDYYRGDIEISINTTDDNIKNFLKISLENFFFKYINEKNVYNIDAIYNKINNTYDSIQIGYSYSYYNDEHRTYDNGRSYYSLITDDTLNISSEKVISHKNYLSNEYSTVSSDVPKEAWGKQFSFPYFKVEKGHIKDVVNDNIAFPDPYDEYRLFSYHQALTSYIEINNAYHCDLVLIFRSEGPMYYNNIVSKYITFDRLYHSSVNTIFFDYKMQEKSSGVQYNVSLPLTLSYSSGSGKITGRFEESFNDKTVNFPEVICQLTIYVIKHSGD